VSKHQAIKRHRGKTSNHFTRSCYTNYI